MLGILFNTTPPFLPGKVAREKFSLGTRLGRKSWGGGSNNWMVRIIRVITVVCYSFPGLAARIFIPQATNALTACERGYTSFLLEYYSLTAN